MSSLSLSEKLRKNKFLKTYLDELSLLLGRVVQQEELGSLDQVKAVREASQKFVGQPLTSFETSFSEKNTKRFRKFIQQLKQANSSPIYVWTTHTIDCGLVQVPSISNIKYDFDFSINNEGILSFLTIDLCDRFVLDFSEPRPNEQKLIIETQGKHWLDVVY